MSGHSGDDVLGELASASSTSLRDGLSAVSQQLLASSRSLFAQRLDEAERSQERAAVALADPHYDRFRAICERLLPPAAAKLDLLDVLSEGVDQVASAIMREGLELGQLPLSAPAVTIGSMVVAIGSQPPQHCSFVICNPYLVLLKPEPLASFWALERYLDEKSPIVFHVLLRACRLLPAHSPLSFRLIWSGVPITCTVPTPKAPKSETKSAAKGEAKSDAKSDAIREAEERAAQVKRENEALLAVLRPLCQAVAFNNSVPLTHLPDILPQVPEQPKVDAAAVAWTLEPLQPRVVLRTRAETTQAQLGRFAPLRDSYGHLVYHRGTVRLSSALDNLDSAEWGERFMVLTDMIIFFYDSEAHYTSGSASPIATWYTMDLSVEYSPVASMLPRPGSAAGKAPTARPSGPEAPAAAPVPAAAATADAPAAQPVQPATSDAPTDRQTSDALLIIRAPVSVRARTALEAERWRTRLGVARAVAGLAMPFREHEFVMYSASDSRRARRSLVLGHRLLRVTPTSHARRAESFVIPLVPTTQVGLLTGGSCAAFYVEVPGEVYFFEDHPEEQEGQRSFSIDAPLASSVFVRLWISAIERVVGEQYLTDSYSAERRFAHALQLFRLIESRRAAASKNLSKVDIHQLEALVETLQNRFVYFRRQYRRANEQLWIGQVLPNVLEDALKEKDNWSIDDIAAPVAKGGADSTGVVVASPRPPQPGADAPGDAGAPPAGDAPPPHKRSAVPLGISAITQLEDVPFDAVLVFEYHRLQPKRFLTFFRRVAQLTSSLGGMLVTESSPLDALRSHDQLQLMHAKMDLIHDFLYRLRAAGLMVSLFDWCSEKGGDDTLYVFVRAPHSVLLREAERLGLRKRLSKEVRRQHKRKMQDVRNVELLGTLKYASVSGPARITLKKNQVKKPKKPIDHATSHTRNIRRFAYVTTLQKSFKDYFEPFTTGKRNLFEDALEPTFFTPSERARLVQSLLSNLRVGAIETEALSINRIGRLDSGFRVHDLQQVSRPALPMESGDRVFERLQRLDVLTRAHPLHVPSELSKVLRLARLFSHVECVNEISRYYGEQIGFLFAFSLYITKFLMWPSGLGFILWLYTTITGDYTRDGAPYVSLSFFLTLWAITVYKGWRRKSQEYATVWHTANVYPENPEISHTGGRVVLDLSTNELRRVKINNIPRVAASYAVMLVMLFSALLASIGILSVDRATHASVYSSVLNYVLPTIAALASVGALALFRRISPRLTKFEAHNFESQFIASQSFKMFIFNFGVLFLPLYYVAFLTKDLSLLATYLFVFAAGICLSEILTGLVSIARYRRRGSHAAVKHDILARWDVLASRVSDWKRDESSIEVGDDKAAATVTVQRWLSDHNEAERNAPAPATPAHAPLDASASGSASRGPATAATSALTSAVDTPRPLADDDIHVLAGAAGTLLAQPATPASARLRSVSDAASEIGSPRATSSKRRPPLSRVDSVRDSELYRSTWLRHSLTQRDAHQAQTLLEREFRRDARMSVSRTGSKLSTDTPASPPALSAPAPPAAAAAPSDRPARPASSLDRGAGAGIAPSVAAPGAAPKPLSQAAIIASAMRLPLDALESSTAPGSATERSRSPSEARSTRSNSAAAGALDEAALAAKAAAEVALNAEAESRNQMAEAVAQVRRFGPGVPDDTMTPYFVDQIVAVCFCALFTPVMSLVLPIIFLLNIVRLRVWLYQLSVYGPRPFPRFAADIGRWDALFSNTCIFIIVTNFLYQVSLSTFFQTTLASAFTSSFSSTYAVYIVAGVLHIMYVARYVVTNFFPETPQWILQQQLKSHFRSRIVSRKQLLADITATKEVDAMEQERVKLLDALSTQVEGVGLPPHILSATAAQRRRKAANARSAGSKS